MFFRCGAKNTINGDNIEFLPNLPSTNVLGIAELNGELYLFTYFHNGSSGSSNYLNYIYKLVDDTWTVVFSTGGTTYHVGDMGRPISKVVSCNGAFYGIGYYKFDGETFTSTNFDSCLGYFPRSFSYENKIYSIYQSDSKVYVREYDTETNTIVKNLLVCSASITSGGYGNYFMLVTKNKIIAANITSSNALLYSLNSDDTWSYIGSTSANGNTSVIRYKDEIHLIGKGLDYTNLNTYRGVNRFHSKYKGYFETVESIFSKILPISDLCGCEYNNKLVLCGFKVYKNASSDNLNICIAIETKGD